VIGTPFPIRRLVNRLRWWHMKRRMGGMVDHVQTLYRFGYTRDEILSGIVAGAELYGQTGEISEAVRDFIRRQAASGDLRVIVWALHPGDPVFSEDGVPEDVRAAHERGEDAS
jgi:hypothetical protein